MNFQLFPFFISIKFNQLKFVLSQCPKPRAWENGTVLVYAAIKVLVMGQMMVQGKYKFKNTNFINGL